MQTATMRVIQNVGRYFSCSCYFLLLEHLQQCSYIAILLYFSYTAAKMMLQQWS